MMRSNEEAFHSKASIYQAIEAQRRALQADINSLSEHSLRSKTPEEVVPSLSAKFSINIPTLDESSITPSRRDVDIDVSRDPSRIAFHIQRQAIVKGTEITIAVPFEGDAEIFQLHASNHTMDYPRGRIDHGRIVFTRQGERLDAAQVRREFDTWIGRIKEHLNGMRNELGSFNDTIKTEIAAAVAARLNKFKRDDDLLGGLGFSSPAKSP